MAGAGIDVTALSKAAFQDFVNSFDAVLCDLDLTVWRRHRPPVERIIPNSDQVLLRLRELGKKVIFVSNSSHASRTEYLAELEASGLTKITTDVIFPVWAVGQYLLSIGFHDKVHVLGSEVHRQELRSWGLQVDDEVVYPRAEYSYSSIAGHLKRNPQVKAVVVDFDPNLSYLKLMQTNVLLLNPDCLFFTTATERVLPPLNGVRFIAVGFFSEILQQATGKSPIECGKPHPFMGELAIKTFSLDPSRTLMIGDSLEQDIGFGTALGMPTLFVPFEHVQASTAQFSPTYYAPTLGHLLQSLEAL